MPSGEPSQVSPGVQDNQAGLYIHVNLIIGDSEMLVEAKLG